MLLLVAVPTGYCGTIPVEVYSWGLAMPHRHDCTFHRPDGSQVSGIRWKNPDGSIGGWVAQTAKIHPTATIEFNALVGPDAIVAADEVVSTERL